MIKDYFNAIPIASELTNFLLNDFEKETLSKLQYDFHDGSVAVSKEHKVLEDPNLKRVKNFIESKVTEYARDVICINNSLRMTQSWSTINKKGSRHHTHNHPNAFVSLVYYVDCDENSGDLVFVVDKNSIILMPGHTKLYLVILVYFQVMLVTIQQCIMVTKIE